MKPQICPNNVTTIVHGSADTYNMKSVQTLQVGESYSVSGMNPDLLASHLEDFLYSGYKTPTLLVNSFQ